MKSFEMFNNTYFSKNLTIISQTLVCFRNLDFKVWHNRINLTPSVIFVVVICAGKPVINACSLLTYSYKKLKDACQISGFEEDSKSELILLVTSFKFL